jgi:hypothetical protein
MSAEVTPTLAFRSSRRRPFHRRFRQDLSNHAATADFDWFDYRDL